MLDTHFHIWDINEKYYTWLTPDLEEIYKHDHNKARNVFSKRKNLKQPSPAPRFSNFDNSLPDLPPPCPGEHNSSAFLDWGID